VSKQHDKVTIATLVIALGIIYGDIGTSPLYVLNAIVHGRVISELLILGSLSCIIWTLTLQTTRVKGAFFRFMRWSGGKNDGW
jgi:KUP system potassium uptake protein